MKESPITETKQIVDDKESRVSFVFPTEFAAGTKVQLQISFSSDLGNSMVGYYRSAWEEDGKTKHYALTQFEVRGPSLIGLNAISTIK